MKKLISFILVLTLIFALPVFANAEGSPSGDPEYDVNIIQVDGATVEGTKNPDGSYTVTITVRDTHEFKKWSIEGEYTLVDCSLTDETITFTYTSDITVKPILTKDGSSQGPVDSDPDSPQTSDNNLTSIAVITLLVALTVVGVFAIKSKTVNE